MNRGRNSKFSSICGNFLFFAVSLTLFARAAFADQQGNQGGNSQGGNTFHASFAGTCHNKDDFSFTGTPIFNGTSGAIRIYCEISGNGTSGQFQGTNTGEDYQVAGGTACNTIPVSLVILTFDAQDQLFLRNSTAGTDCLNFMTGVGNPQVTFTVVGGTGRYQGATGTVAENAKVIFLAISALGGDGFITAISGSLDGTVTAK